MRTAQELFEELNSYDESVRIEAKKASEVGRSILETICAFSNEPDLGGGYVLLGAVRKGFDENGLPHYEPENIANPDKIQTDIANQCASVFSMCQEGLFELRGQRRNAYYIAGQEFVRLNSKCDDEMCRADGEMCRADGEMCRADGEISRANGEISRADGLNNRADGLNSRADGLNSRADGLNSRADSLPLELKERIKQLGKRTNPKEMESLIIDLCNWNPLSLKEIAKLINRKTSSVRYLYLNKLIAQGKLFYTIPEMLNHPNQKYTTKKKQ